MPEKRLDPKNDFIFQLLFGKQDNKDILIDLLNACSSEDLPYPVGSSRTPQGVTVETQTLPRLSRWWMFIP